MTLADGRKIAIGIRLENKGNDLSVNEIATIHGKTDSKLLQDWKKSTPEWLQENIKWVEKEKVLDWLGMVPPKGTTLTDPKLLAVAKVIQNFQNPKISSERFQKQEEPFTPLGKRAWEKLIERLKKSGLAKDVVIDQKAYDKEFANHRHKFTGKDGRVYGFVTPDGVVYLDPNRMNANTPVHEFGHLFWSAAMPAEMKAEITELLKQTPGWEKLSSNPAYAHLKTDDQKADELFNTILGDYGELTPRVRGIVGDNVTLWAKIQHAINEFINWLKANVFNDTEAKLNVFAKKTLGELLGGKEIQPSQSRRNNATRSQSKIQYAKQSDYDFDVSDITEANAQEMKSIKAEAQANGTFMKAPNGKKSNLNERQWLQVRTKAFKRWFGDWESAAQYDYLLSENWVSELTGNEFQKDAIPLTEKVTQFYLDKYNGEIEREGLGTVVLNERGVKDSMAHGIGSKKSAAFAAVPDIIKNGIIIDKQSDWKGRGYDSRIIAAPIKIGNTGYMGIVIVTSKAGSNRFYLHEVMLQENLRNGFKTSQAGSPLGDVAKVLQKFETAKNNSSKVVDENGEPMAVYHGTSQEFTVFDRSKSNTAYGCGQKDGLEILNF
jgi:hypothetical protein